MKRVLSLESLLEFTLGLIFGKLIGTIVSTMPYAEYITDSRFSDIYWVEFTQSLLSLNGYHIMLAIICGLILVVWRSENLFD